MKLNPKEIKFISDLLGSVKEKDLNAEQIDIFNGLQNKLSNDDKFELFADGAADLHTQTAGIGGVIYRNGEELYSYSEFIGSATNNEAEYTALIRGLELMKELKGAKVQVFLDSELVVKQINGEYKVKNDRMKILHSKAVNLIDQFDSFNIAHILRDRNKEADKLSKKGMEKGRSAKK